MKTIAFILSVIVVFSTTYSMILPAITLSDSAAGEEPGIFFEDTEELTAGEETEFTYEEEYTEEFPEEPETEPEAEAEPDPEWDYEYEEEAEEWDSDPGETEEVDDLALEGAEENLYEAEDAVTTEDGADDQPEAGQTEVQTEPASQDDAESVTVSPEVYEEFLTSEQSAQDGRYLIVRITDDGRYVAMNRDGAVVPVDYNADDNTASCDDENQELVWVKSGNSLHTPDDERYVRLTDESVGFSVVFDEPSSVSIEKPDDHQYAGAVYRTVVTDGVPEYYALVLSEDQTYFTAVAIDTKPVKRTILAKEAPSDPNESETESDDEPVSEEASSDAESAWETVSSEVESAVEMTVSEVDSVAEGVESEVDSVAEGVFSDAESAAEEVLTVYESGERTIQVEGADYTIHISWPAEAMIPEDAVFTAVSLDQKKGYETYKEEALNVAAGEDSDARKRSSALGVFDLTITDAAGAVIEPSAPVSVSVDFGESLDPETSVLAVHFLGTGEQPEEDDGIEYDEVKINVDASTAAAIDAVNEDGAVSFEADSFSVYVIVGTTIEKMVLASDGSNYRITVTYGSESGIPVDAELTVEEILPIKQSDERAASIYDEYVSKAENALGMEEGSAGYIRLFDISIVDKNDQNIKYQPAEGTSVEVRIELADSESESLSVVHFADENAEGDTVFTENDGHAIVFEADGFSVYAVVDEGDTSSNARMTVEFYNGDELIASMIVKNSDSLEQLKTILYDPGVGTIPEGVLFDGWTFEKNYTLEDANNAMSIGEVREWAEAKTITEHETVKLYAALVKTFTVTYLDERNASLGTDNVTMIAGDTSVNYTVNMGYTPVDKLHNFAGWNVSTGSSNIVGYEDGMTYENGTEITITGNVVLSVNAPEGHWLVFNENGKGATYNAPVFVESGAITIQPEKTKEGYMTRSGYTFGGWYTDAACTDGNEFEFGNPITDNTTIYAKWIVNPEAEYTLIVWRQSVSDNYDAADSEKTYDFAFSTVLNAATGTNINALDLSAYQNKDGQTISVDGENYSFYGFKYNTTKGVVANKDQSGQAVTTVLPNGTTVVNLYYDREVVTYDFLVQNGYKNAGTPNWNSDTRYYYKTNGNYYRCYRQGNGTYYYVPFTGNKSNNTTYYILYNGEWYEYQRVNFGSWYSPDYEWVFEYGGRYYYWDGPIYTRNRVTGVNQTYYVENWETRETYSGLYGQKLSKYDYVWPTDLRWLNAINGSTFTSIMDMFGSSVNSNPSDEFHSNFYGSVTAYNTNVYHYLQNVDKTWPEAPTYTIPTVIGNGMVFRNFQGFTASEFRIKLPNGITSYTTGTSYANADAGTLNNPVSHTTSDGWTDWLPYGTGVEYDGNTWHETFRWTATEGGIEFRYTRNEYPLTYMVGRFENADGEHLDSPITGKLKDVTNIEYEDSLSSYAEGGENYYEPEAVPGYVFAGWYIDSTCTTPVDFENSTMPLNGMTVYGKWVQEQYRVFLHPNTTDSTLDWGSGSTAMNFRVSLGGTVSVPNGRRTGYELIGWYLDEACTQALNADAYKLNDVTVTTLYDKSVDFTDVMDKWGNGATWNADTDRFWINKKLDLYAKWRAVLEGADGIGVVYDANGGTNAPTDTTLYLDSAQAVAQGASTAPVAAGDDPQQVFLYWVQQTWDEEQNKFVDVEGADHIYPGDNFEVLKENAKRVVNEYYDDGVTIKSATYTVQLRAEYGDAESHTPTHIYWYANNASGNVIKTNEVAGQEREFFQINEAMPIKNPLDFDSVESVDQYGYYHFKNNTGSYKFLGWARIPEENGQDKNLTESDLFLTYHEENGGYYTAVVDDEEKVVSQVAADEVTPYHDMYAVWERWGYLKIGKHFDVQEFYLDGVDMESRWHTLEFTIKDSSGNYVTLKDDPGSEEEGHFVYDGAQADESGIPLSTFVHETGSSNPHEHQYFIYAWVPVDTYTVEENHTQAAELITGYERQNSVYSATATVANSCVYGELTNIGSGEARIDNIYRGSNNYAYLKVEKTVAGDAPGSLTNNKDFYFIVKNNTLNAYISTTDRTFTTDTSKIQVYKLKPGGALFYANTGNQVNGNHIQVIGDNEYSVIELDVNSVPVAAPESPKIDGYSWEQAVAPTTVTADKNEEKTITITNTYTARYGSLQLEKILDQEGDLPEGAADHEYQFTVVNSEGKYVADANGTLSDTKAVLKVKPGAANKVLISNLEPGSYTVTEVTENDPDYTQTVSIKAGSAETVLTETVTVDVSKSQTVEVVVTNSYERVVTDIYLNKVDKNNQTVLLPNAEFRLYRKNASGTYAVDESIEATKASAIHVLEDGTLKIEGLPSGDYMITEEKAPAGYVILAKDLYFTVNASPEEGEGIITVTSGQTAYTDISIGAGTKQTSKKDDTFIIPNTPGAQLPSTGGPGTTALYLLGIMLTGIAGAGLVMRKRRRI